MVEVITKYKTNDGVLCDSREEAEMHEARAPFLQLLADVRRAVEESAIFASDIEAIGTKLARERRERGDLRRQRTARIAHEAAAQRAEPEASEVEAPCDVEAGDRDEADLNEAA